MSFKYANIMMLKLGPKKTPPSAPMAEVEPPTCIKSECTNPRRDFGPSLGRSYYCQSCLYKNWSAEDAYMSD